MQILEKAGTLRAKKMPAEVDIVSLKIIPSLKKFES